MLNQLVKIYNTMLTIATRGEDTVIMAECLKAFREVIYSTQETYTATFDSPDQGE